MPCYDVVGDGDGDGDGVGGGCGLGEMDGSGVPGLVSVGVGDGAGGPGCDDDVGEGEDWELPGDGRAVGYSQLSGPGDEVEALTGTCPGVVAPEG